MCVYTFVCVCVMCILCSYLCQSIVVTSQCPPYTVCIFYPFARGGFFASALCTLVMLEYNCLVRLAFTNLRSFYHKEMVCSGVRGPTWSFLVEDGAGRLSNKVA